MRETIDMIDENLIPYVYSLDELLKPAVLRKGDIDLRGYDIEPLRVWMQENNIVGHLIGAQSHYKFSGIQSKPFVMYSMGDVSLLDAQILALVGPRKPSTYMHQVIEEVFQKLPSYALVTISGGADGIDRQGHELSMKHGIPTIVVLGGGFAHYLRGSKRGFLEKVVTSGGLVLSEFRLKQKPMSWSFPQRNRIVAGLADVVFLPGASLKSGSLITVDFANSMHKPVYTVPAGIFDQESLGSNEYLVDGKLALVQDFSQMLDAHFPKKNLDSTDFLHASLDLSDLEKRALGVLREHGSLRFEAFCEGLNVSAADGMCLTLDLELKGCIWEKEVGVWGLK